MRGQTDIFGLLLIFVMVAFIGIIFLGLSLRTESISKDSVFFIFEPMLATGGTITTVLERIKSLGVKRIYVLSVIISENAKKILEIKFPRVNFYVSGIDPTLNDHGYIVPGLGDAGDRAFNM